MPLGFGPDSLEPDENEVSDIAFASAEARFELLRARRLRLVLHIAAMALVLLAATTTAVALLARRGYGLGDGSAFGDSRNTPPKLNIAPVGSEDAKVQVVAVLPGGSDCHSGVAKFLTDIATARPEEIRVEFVSIDEFSVTKPDLQRKIGQPCAAVVINEDVNFRFRVAGKERSVTLVGNEPANYKMADVGEALTQVYKARYGDPGEPLYKLEPTCASGGTCQADHDHPAGESAPPEVEPAPIALPSKLPPIRGIE